MWLCGCVHESDGSEADAAGAVGMGLPLLLGFWGVVVWGDNVRL